MHMNIVPIDPVSRLAETAPTKFFIICVKRFQSSFPLFAATDTFFKETQISFYHFRSEFYIRLRTLFKTTYHKKGHKELNRCPEWL